MPSRSPPPFTTRKWGVTILDFIHLDLFDLYPLPVVAVVNLLDSDRHFARDVI